MEFQLVFILENQQLKTNILMKWLKMVANKYDWSRVTRGVALSFLKLGILMETSKSS